jgi:hypothetical protein
MIKSFENFVKLVKKLDDYYILSQDEEHIIVGTKVTVRDDTPIVNTMSSMLYRPMDNAYHEYNKILPVFFLVTIAKRQTDLDKIFIKNDLSILSINNQKNIDTLEHIRELFDNFIKYNFKCIN